MKWSLVTNVRGRSYYTEREKLNVVSKNEIILLNKNPIDINSDVLWRFPPSAKTIFSLGIIARNSSQAADIIQGIWERRKVRGILLVPNQNNTEIFDIYTWEPHNGGNCMNDAGLIKIIDQCSQGKLLEKNVLFTNNPLKNCTLVAGYINVPPYVIGMKNNSIGTEEYSDTQRGIEVNILNLIAKLLNIRICYINSDSMGDVDSVGVATGNLKMLIESKTDIAIGSYSRTPEREHILETTHPYMYDVSVWCVPYFKIQTGGFCESLMLDPLAHSIVIALVIVLSMLLWGFSKLARTEGDVKTCGKIFICVMAVTTSVAVNHRPKTSSVRLIFMSIVILSFYVNTIFLSQWTGILSSGSVKQKYGNIQDINEQNLTIYYTSNSGHYFRNMKLKEEFKNGIECQDRTACVRYVAIRRDSALFAPKLTVEHISKPIVSPNNRPLVHYLEDDSKLQKTMLMRKGSHLSVLIDKLTSRFIETGLILKWKRDTMRLQRKKEIFDFDLGEADKIVLTLRDLIPALWIICVLYGISVFVFIIELLVYRKRFVFIN
ncbi:hypothetical protein JTB14_033387 [Gonioctena quinquepunctata]|nr:hypothetical protein JTB14_033387 [Gonioctena quinquepunctata]